jgi:hypothetical protein
MTEKSFRMDRRTSHIWYSAVSGKSLSHKKKDKKEMKKATVKFQVEINDFNEYTADSLEAALRDLLKKAVLPALNVELVPLSLDVKKARS